MNNLNLRLQQHKDNLIYIFFLRILNVTKQFLQHEVVKQQQYFYDDFRFQQWQELKGTDSFQLDHSDKKDNKFGTVGAVACDKNGNLAAATSTGGMTPWQPQWKPIRLPSPKRRCPHGTKANTEPLNEQAIRIRRRHDREEDLLHRDRQGSLGLYRRR